MTVPSWMDTGPTFGGEDLLFPELDPSEFGQALLDWWNSNIDSQSRALRSEISNMRRWQTIAEWGIPAYRRRFMSALDETARGLHLVPALAQAFVAAGYDMRDEDVPDEVAEAAEAIDRERQRGRDRLSEGWRRTLQLPAEMVGIGNETQLVADITGLDREEERPMGRIERAEAERAMVERADRYDPQPFEGHRQGRIARELDPSVGRFTPVTDELVAGWTANQNAAGVEDPRIGQAQVLSALGFRAYLDRDAGNALVFWDDQLQQYVMYADIQSSYLGIPEDTAEGMPGLYRVIDDEYLAWQERVANAAPENLIGVYNRRPEGAVRAPTYRPGDEYANFNGMSPDKQRYYEGLFEELGMLQPETYVPGAKMNRNENVFREGYILASRNGRTFDEWIHRQVGLVREMGGLPDDGGGGGSGRVIDPWAAPTYVAPDVDMMRQAVRRTFADQLGRDVHDYELVKFADYLNSEYKAKHEAVVAESRANYDARVAAIRSGVAQTEYQTVQGVDPLMSLAERIEEKYVNEIDQRQDIDERAYNAQLVMRAMGVAEGLES